MNPDAQKNAIAKICGWRVEYYQARPTSRPYGAVHISGLRAEDLPDYLNDLNAMHEAEKVMSPKKFLEYHDILMGLVGGETPFATYATAAQRAEAFLRTLDKWR